jgi:hypothetical protein
VRDLVWPRADPLVWHDPPLPPTLRRSSLRAIRQTRSQQPICDGNRQRLGALVFGREPVLWRAIKTAPQRHRAGPALLEMPEHRRLQAVPARQPAAVVRWQAAAARAPRGRRAPQAGNTPVDR